MQNYFIFMHKLDVNLCTKDIDKHWNSAWAVEEMTHEWSETQAQD